MIHLHLQHAAFHHAVALASIPLTVALRADENTTCSTVCASQMAFQLLAVTSKQNDPYLKCRPLNVIAVTEDIASKRQQLDVKAESCNFSG